MRTLRRYSWIVFVLFAFDFVFAVLGALTLAATYPGARGARGGGPA